MAELPDNKNQEESSSYTPASPVKRIIAWVGVTYMLIFVLLNLYPFFHGGAYLQGLAPLLVCPGAAGLAGPGLVGAVEAVEHVGQAAGVDALALVLDGEAGHAVPQGGGQGDVPSGGGVFDGVVH